MKDVKSQVFQIHFNDTSSTGGGAELQIVKRNCVDVNLQVRVKAILSLFLCINH